jgi:hypothetical protein
MLVTNELYGPLLVREKEWHTNELFKPLLCVMLVTNEFKVII